MAEPRTYNIARPSVASLLITMTVRGNHLALGTGFVVQHEDKAYLVTNRHNLSGRHPETNKLVSPTGAAPDTVTIYHNAEEQLGTWLTVNESLVDDEDIPLWFEHPAHGRKVDVVALPLTKTQGVALYPHDPWRTEPDVNTGVSEGINIIGFPFGLVTAGAMGVWTRGFVASEPDFDFNDLPMFLVDARTRSGQSGSPVIFYSSGGGVLLRGGTTAFFGGPTERFLGVYSGRVNPNSDLGFVWKASAVQEIIEGGIRNPAS